MSNITRSVMIAEYALAQVGGAYIYGATARECTPAYRRARISQYPEFKSSITKYCPVLSGKQDTCAGCKYQGKKAHDCAQLSRYAAKAAGLTLPSGASSQWRKGDWAEKGSIADMPLDKVCFVYREDEDSNPMAHVGVYLGDGRTVDSRSHAKGTLLTKLEDYRWTHYARLRGMDDEYTDEVPEQETITDQRDTIRKGAKNTTVTELQGLLLKHGYSLPKYGADGEFGSETESAVKAFQAASGLAPDGIVGPATWDALLAEPEPAKYSVTITGLTDAEASEIVAKYGGTKEVTTIAV